MQTELTISGFGGQGALFAGTLLAFTGLENGKHVTWIPSYGPEMRGGTAHCTVIVADEEIGSPVVRHPAGVIVMNIPSLERYEPLVKTGGVLIVNSSLVDRRPERTDLVARMIPANEIAEQLGDKRMANMVLLGGYLAVQPVFTLEQVGASLEKHIPAHRRNLLGKNLEAMRRGADLAVEAVGIVG
ncbi:MAG TPA: 2-oxoacid:acceptor oxidoreductase family protein [Anaerolineales bacterium]|nr:2-oxoacid:acceptor oxidoreductase family protein [Anaerolineales bacterium]